MKKLFRLALMMSAAAVSLTVASCGGGGGGGGGNDSAPSGDENAPVHESGYAPSQSALVGKMISGTHANGYLISWEFEAGGKIRVLDNSYKDYASGTYTYEKIGPNTATLTYHVEELGGCTDVDVTVTLSFYSQTRASVVFQESYTTTDGTRYNRAPYSFTMDLSDGI